MAQSYSVEAVLSAQDNMSNVFRNAASNASSMSSAISNAVSGINVKMAAAGAAITAFGASSVKDFASFENSLNKAAVVAGGTSKDIDGLGDVAIQMSNSLGISAQECSNAFMSMARDGASVGDIKKEFPAIAQAATASGEDISSVAGVVQNAMNVWGKSIESPQRAAAVLVQTANQSNASIESMQQGLANMAPVASQAGVSLQDTSTALGLLTNKGFSTAQASQDLSHAILQMVAPSSTAAAKAKELGISFVDASGKMKPLPSILQELTEKTANMGDAQKTAALKTMFGTAGYQAIAPLMEAMADKTGDAKTSWDAFSKSVDEASSSTAVATKFLQSQASEMTQNLGAKLSILKQNWTNFGIVAQQSNNKAAMSMVDFASKALQWATTSKSSAAGVIRSIAGLSPVIGPAMTMASGFFTKFNAIVTGTKTVVGALGAPFRMAGNLISKLGSSSNEASVGTEKLGSSSEQAGQKVSRSRTSANKMIASAKSLAIESLGAAAKLAALGVAAAGIGAGIGQAASGVADLVNAMSNLASQGGAGVAVIGIFAATVVALSSKLKGLISAISPATAGIMSFGNGAGQMQVKTASGVPSLKQMASAMEMNMTNAKAASLQMISFGASALEIGAAVGVAAAGVAVLVNSIANLASTGNAGIAAMATFGVTVAGLAAVFALLGPALDASSAGLIAFGVAVGGVGIGIGAATAGIAALITALTTFNGTGTQVVTVLGSIGAGFAAMVAQFLVGITTAIPQVIQSFAQMMVQSVAILAAYAPQFMYNGIMLLTNLMNGVAQGAPQLIAAFFNMLNSIIVSITSQLPTFMANGVQMIVAMFQGVAQGAPQLIAAFFNMLNSIIVSITAQLPTFLANGAQMIVALLQGIAQQIPKVVPAAVHVVTTFLTTLAANLPKLISAGMQVIIAFLQGVAKNIAQVVTAALNVIAQFLAGLAKGLPGVINKAVDVIVAFVKGIANNLGKVIQAGVDLIFKFIDGLVEQIPKIADKAVDAVMQFVYGVGYTLGRVVSSGGQLIQNFVRGIMNGIRASQNAGRSNGNAAGQGADSQRGFLNQIGRGLMSMLEQGISGMWNSVTSAARNIVKGVIDTIEGWGKNLETIGHNMMVGLANGISSMASSVWNAAKNIAKGAVDIIQSALNIHSPSRVMKNDVGVYIPQGMALGMLKDMNYVERAGNKLANAAVMSVPGADTTEFTNSLDSLYATNKSLNGGTLGIDNKYRLSMEQQPAYINLTMGNHNWGTFVDDISTKQGSQAVLQNNYRI